MITRVCSKCRIPYPLEDYGVCGKRRDGTIMRRPECSHCRHERRAELDANETVAPTEAALQAYTTRVLTAAGWLVTRAHAGYVRGRRAARDGTADLICSARGRYIEIEIKSRRGKLRPAQVKRRAIVEANGGQYWVVRSRLDVMDLLQSRAAA